MVGGGGGDNEGREWTGQSACGEHSLNPLSNRRIKK